MNHSDTEVAEILARIDERVKNIANQLAEMKGKMNTKFVTQDEWKPVRMLVYGCVTTILLGVVGAAMAIFLRE